MSNLPYFFTLTFRPFSSLRCGYGSSKEFPAVQMLSCTDFFQSVSTYTFLHTLTICSPNSRLKSRVYGSLLINSCHRHSANVQLLFRHDFVPAYPETVQHRLTSLQRKNEITRLRIECQAFILLAGTRRACRMAVPVP